MPHRTTTSGVGGPPPPSSTSGKPMRRPWLVSWAMWANYLRYINVDGSPVGDRVGPARKLQAWGYAIAKPDPADARANPPFRDWLIRPTAAGLYAGQVWEPLPDLIEGRWRERFGVDVLDDLRRALLAVCEQIEYALPGHMPELGYGLRVDAERLRPRARRERAGASQALPALLSGALLAFTLSFERSSALSLAISANVLRLTGDDGVRTRDLPQLSGVSREAIAMAVSFLEKRGYAVVETDPVDGRSKLLTLTKSGREARDAYPGLVRDIERRWQQRFAADAVANLRRALESLTSSPRWAPPIPPAGVWRAKLTRPAGPLPHQPIVLHRGGYPDGS